MSPCLKCFNLLWKESIQAQIFHLTAVSSFFLCCLSLSLKTEISALTQHSGSSWNTAEKWFPGLHNWTCLYSAFKQQAGWMLNCPLLCIYFLNKKELKIPWLNIILVAFYASTAGRKVLGYPAQHRGERWAEDMTWELGFPPLPPAQLLCSHLRAGCRKVSLLSFCWECLCCQGEKHCWLPGSLQPQIWTHSSFRAPEGDCGGRKGIIFLQFYSQSSQFQMWVIPKAVTVWESCPSTAPSGGNHPNAQTPSKGFCNSLSSAAGFVQRDLNELRGNQPLGF